MRLAILKVIRIATALLLLMSTSSVSVFAERLSVFVSILPQRYFVQQIGKERVDVQVMVEPGASPHHYEPKPRQMAVLSKARLYFAVGVPFESAWLEEIQTANPRLTIVHTEDGIRKVPMSARHDDGGEQSGDGEPHEDSGHDHGRLDPHIWLSPPLVKVQAGHILKALIAEDPDNGESYRSNYDAFIHDLDRLHDQLTAIFADRKDEAFLVYHPSWGYFADTYGIRQVPIELEGKSPKPAHLEALITRARKEGIRVVFVQPQFSKKSAATVARAIAGEVVFADPLAADWSDNLRRQAERFQAALKPAP